MTQCKTVKSALRHLILCSAPRNSFTGTTLTGITSYKVTVRMLAKNMLESSELWPPSPNFEAFSALDYTYICYGSKNIVD